MADQLEVASVAHRLHALGARRGAFLILCNAAAQRQAAEMRDRTEGPAMRGVVKPAPDLNPANDHAVPSAKPAPVGGGL